MMGTILSTIKSNPFGRWYIELKDTMHPSDIQICLDIEEYAQKIEAIGEIYNSQIEVLWSSEENVSSAQINEIRREIMAHQEAQELKQTKPTHSIDGTPNFEG